MRDISWDKYRHPNFLQSLAFTLNELKILKLFLKIPNFKIDANQEHLSNSTLVSPGRSINHSKFLTQKKVSIKI